MVQIADKAPILRVQHWMGVDRSISRTPQNLRHRVNYVGLRYDGGMLVYGSCSSSELLMFAINRKLNPPAKASDRQLVTLLEENEKFPRFLDLPAELRSFIYQNYFDFNPHKYIGIRVPPPVTEVNKMLRGEAVPQFWAEQRLPMRMLAWPLQGQLTFDGDSSRFFRRATEEHIRMVKRLHVRFHYCNSGWELDLSRGEKPPTVRRVQGRVQCCRQHQFDEPLLKFLNSIGKRPESVSFSRRTRLEVGEPAQRAGRRGVLGTLVERGHERRAAAGEQADWPKSFPEGGRGEAGEPTERFG